MENNSHRQASSRSRWALWWLLACPLTGCDEELPPGCEAFDQRIVSLDFQPDDGSLSGQGLLDLLPEKVIQELRVCGGETSDSLTVEIEFDTSAARARLSQGDAFVRAYLGPGSTVRLTYQGETVELTALNVMLDAPTICYRPGCTLKPGRFAIKIWGVFDEAAAPPWSILEPARGPGMGTFSFHVNSDPQGLNRSMGLYLGQDNGELADLTEEDAECSSLFAPTIVAFYSPRANPTDPTGRCVQ